MLLQSHKSKSLLQRRSNVSSSMQAMLDGLSVILIAWGLVAWHLDDLNTNYMLLIVVVLGLMSVLYDYFDVYRDNTKFTHNFSKLFNAWSITFLGLLLLAFVTKQSQSYSRVIVAELFVLGLIAQISLHYIVQNIQLRFLKNPDNQENVLIVGQGILPSYLQARIANNPWIGQKVVGAVGFETTTTIDPKKQPVTDVPLLGHLNDISRIILQYQIKVVYIVTPLESSGVAKEAYGLLLGKNVTVHWVPDIYSLRLVNHSFTEVAGLPVLTLSETPLIGINKIAKSLEDLILSSIILILIAPILAVVAIAVKLDSEGPIFFRQNRAGWNGKTFKIWKFRSMVVHQEEAGKVKQAQKNDPRITRVGAFIRKTSLDELPQIFNVLMGDMSLVGPRPHAIQHDEEYSKRIDDYFARHQIKPGITGLAQIRGLRGETKDIDEMAQRVEADIEYINNWSVWLDFMILIKTTTAFTGNKAY